MLNMDKNEVHKFTQALLPAVLSNTIENAAAVASYVKKHGLPHNADSCVTAVKALLFTEAFTWDIEPKALAARKADEAPAKVENPLQLEAERTAKTKVADAATAYAKQQTAYLKTTVDLIESFLPISRGRVQHSKQNEVQKLLLNYVEKEKARGVSMKAVHEKVAEYIQEQYALMEKASERV